MQSAIPLRPSSNAPRRTRRALLLPLLLAAALLGAACMGPAQEAGYTLVNSARVQAGVPGLAPDPVAQAKAQAWAERLAARGSLDHSRLGDGMDDGWRRLAENVGYGESVEAVHRQFMESSAHRANILDGRMTHLGVGVARGGGRTWVVLVFVQR